MRSGVGFFLAGLWLAASSAGALWPAEPTLYTVATAHLDTQWRWTIRRTIDEYLLRTLDDNFALLEQHPDYVFSFEGAFRYRLMQEYYPERYERLKRYVADGRWRLCGSWLDAVDVNIPAPESLIRHALYGRAFFQQEFGLESRDVFLPDCFGFSYALPTIAAHCGLTGFSTQKLTWGSAHGVPFDLGLWEGVDGSAVVAALAPGAYVSTIEADLSRDSTWIARVTRQAEISGVQAGYKYYGTGDTGGAPTPGSVAWVERSLAAGAPLRVLPAGADQLARDLTAPLSAAVGGLPLGLRPGLCDGEQAGPLRGLPRYRGELVMTDHGVGCYTSQSAMKRWNRQNERLADAAERAAVVAHWLGQPYPRAKLREAWERFLWHQFHDDLTGTSIPEAYLYSWNDELLSLNQFAAVLTDAVAGVSRALDTRAEGAALVVYNPLSIEREDLVEAEVVFGGDPPAAVRVFDDRGEETPAQMIASTDEGARIVFLARVPAVGFAVYDARPSAEPCALVTGVRADASSLANRRYEVKLGLTGDIVSIRDLSAARELLAGPAELQLLDDEPHDWAAWEIDHDDLMARPRTVVGVPARTRVIENGPARAVLEVTRECEGSRFVQRIVLGAGGSRDRVEIDAEIDWRTPGTLLKAAFPLAVRNPLATYDLGLGTIERGTNRPELYEVPGQSWARVTDTGDAYGVAILNDCRYGWDRPDEATLRLTLLHTPRVNERWQWIDDQRSQDLGRHRVRYAVQGYAGDWFEHHVVWAAERHNQPLRAFQVPLHPGSLGRSFSFAALGAPARAELPLVAIRALKLAEESDEIVCRLQELEGAVQERVELSLEPILTGWREVNGAEEPVGATDPAGRIARGDLVTALGAHQPRAFALTVEPPAARPAPVTGAPVDLPYNLDGISSDADRTDGDFDGAGRTLPAELLPETVVDGVEFRTGPRAPGWANVVVCQGQTIALPEVEFDGVYLLAGAVGGDRAAGFELDGRPHDLVIRDHASPLGQWCNRVIGGELTHDPARIEPAYIKEDRVAWVGTHRHGPQGENRAYEITQLFRYRLDRPRGVGGTLRLPDDPAVRLLAVSVASDEAAAVRATATLHDRERAAFVRFGDELRDFLGTTQVTLSAPCGPAEIRYTLDGTLPGPDALRYTGPITLDRTACVKARAFVPGCDDAFVADAVYTRREPRAADAVEHPLPGLACRYYEGEWRSLPEFAELVPPRTDTIEQVRLPGFQRPEQFGLVFNGYLAVPRDGVYTLHLWSDDGSTLRIGDEVVIDNDGLHGRQERMANVALAAGLHAIEVRYFQGPGGADLELGLEGPGLPLGPVPVEAWFHVHEQILPRR